VAPPDRRPDAPLAAAVAGTVTARDLFAAAPDTAVAGMAPPEIVLPRTAGTDAAAAGLAVAGIGLFADVVEAPFSFDRGTARFTSTYTSMITLNRAADESSSAITMPLTTLPSIMCSFSRHTSSALRSSSNTMNPKPLDLCVSLLNITSAWITFPYFSK
jgi:hypothetical protein